MDLGLKDKRIVVTGAGSGIGRTTAIHFAREGARVCLVGRTPETLEGTLDLLEPGEAEHRVEAVDLFDDPGVDAFAERLAADWGGADVLVNNACSLASLKKAHEIDLERWHAFVDGNLAAVFHLCKAFLPAMVEAGWGRIVNVGSLTALLGSSHYAEYATVKSGLEGLTRVLAVEYSRHGVTANLIHPGFIRTERFEKAAPPKLLPAFVNATSAKRLGEPADVADLILFLSSDRAAYVTGSLIPIGGGAGFNNLW